MYIDHNQTFTMQKSETPVKGIKIVEHDKILNSKPCYFYGHKGVVSKITAKPCPWLVMA